MTTAIGSGNTISIWPRSRPLQIDRAAASASIMNGIGNVFLAVSSVRTKPGHTVVTETPCGGDARRGAPRAC